MTPQTLPIPPRITITSTKTEKLNEKLSGLAPVVNSAK